MTKRKKKKNAEDITTLSITGDIYFAEPKPADKGLVGLVLNDPDYINISAKLFKDRDSLGSYFSILEAFFKELIDDTVDISEYPIKQIISIVDAHNLLEELLRALPDSAWFGEVSYNTKPLESYSVKMEVFTNDVRTYPTSIQAEAAKQIRNIPGMK